MGRFRKIWQKCRQNVVEDGLPPEPLCDIDGFGAGGAVEALVGGAGAESAEVGLVTADFHVIKQLCVAREGVVARIPRDFQFCVLTQMPGQRFHVVGLCVAPHEADAGDLLAVFVQQRIQRLFGQGMTDVFAQVRAVAAHAPVRAVGDVHGEGHLVGDLLEDDIVVVVF